MSDTDSDTTDIDALSEDLRALQTEINDEFGRHHPYTIAINSICENIQRVFDDPDANEHTVRKTAKQQMKALHESMVNDLDTIAELQEDAFNNTDPNAQHRAIGLWLKDEYNLDDHAIICGNCGAPNDLDAVKQQECCHNCRAGIPV